jgi:hypothetical protein
MENFKQLFFFLEYPEKTFQEFCKDVKKLIHFYKFPSNKFEYFIEDFTEYFIECWEKSLFGQINNIELWMFNTDIFFDEKFAEKYCKTENEKIKQFKLFFGIDTIHINYYKLAFFVCGYFNNKQSNHLLYSENPFVNLNLLFQDSLEDFWKSVKENSIKKIGPTFNRFLWKYHIYISKKFFESIVDLPVVLVHILFSYIFSE